MTTDEVKTYLRQAYKLDKRLRREQMKLEKLRSAVEYHSPAFDGAGGYDSADTGEDDYRKTVSAFKAKWFKGDRCERLKGYIDEEIKATENRLIKMLNDCKD